MAPTATIRVPLDTRDSLARIAESYGLSLSKLLTEFAAREHRHLVFASERAAAAADHENPLALAEYSLWDESESDDFESDVTD